PGPDLPPPGPPPPGPGAHAATPPHPRAGAGAAAGPADLGPMMQCSVCQWVYDPAKGEPNQDVQPGTPWSEVPDNFLCPECSLGKDVFDVLATEAK
ncbi:rubredoxin, partial [Klebsiella pneumoniae]|uniref:rubredoxin n=1 Tax=Klebsiella pneumoniae TaxID=573 RepID=UPI003F5DF725